jgi:hypothetical protein
MKGVRKTKNNKNPREALHGSTRTLAADALTLPLRDQIIPINALNREREICFLICRQTWFLDCFVLKGCKLSPVDVERETWKHLKSWSVWQVPLRISLRCAPPKQFTSIHNHFSIYHSYDVDASLTDSKRHGKKLKCDFLVGYFTFVVIDTSHRSDLPQHALAKRVWMEKYFTAARGFSLPLKKNMARNSFFFERGKSVFIEFVSNRNRQTCSATRAADENSNELQTQCERKKPAPWWQKH